MIALCLPCGVLEICKELRLEYPTRKVILPDREAAKLWIIAHQLGRRNLRPNDMSYFRGVLYNARKHQGTPAPVTSGHSDQKQTTAETLADTYGVAEKTIRRDGDFANHLDTLEQSCGPDIRRKVLSGEASLTRQEIKQLASLPANKQPKAVAKALKKANAPRPKQDKPTDADVLHKAWDNAKEEGKKSFLAEILEDESTVSRIEALGFELCPADPRDSESEDESTGEEAGVEEEEDEV